MREGCFFNMYISHFILLHNICYVRNLICVNLKEGRYICGMCGLSDISLFSIEVKGKVFFFFFLYWNFDEGSIKWGKNTEGQVQNRFKGDKATYNIYNTYIYIL